MLAIIARQEGGNAEIFQRGPASEALYGGDLAADVGGHDISQTEASREAEEVA